MNEDTCYLAFGRYRASFGWSTKIGWPTTSIASQRFFLWLCVALTGFSIGCGARYPVSEYGVSEGEASRLSPDGLAVFRQICANRKLPTSTIGSLPPSSRSGLSTVVWIPTGFGSCNQDCADWLNRWMESDQKTLVFVGRDYSPAEEYWTIASRQQSDAEATNRSSTNASLERSQLDERQLSAHPIASFPWGWSQRVLGSHQTIESFAGAWSSDLSESKHLVRLRSTFQTWNDVDDRELNQYVKEQEEALAAANPTGAATTPPPAIAKSPLFGLFFPGDEKGLVHSQNEKKDREEDRKQRSVQQRKNEPRWKTNVVLETDDDRPLITIVTRPQWKGSKLILLANASLIANVNLVNEGNFGLGKRIVDEFYPGRVGFLTVNGSPRVRADGSADEGISSLFTTQLNVLSVHIAFLGILALIVLWPIFGRPRILPVVSTQSFSQHINALGLLLQRTSDQFFAMATIGDYFRNVKKDQHSPWAHYDTNALTEPSSPFKPIDPQSPTQTPPQSPSQSPSQGESSHASSTPNAVNGNVE